MKSNLDTVTTNLNSILIIGYAFTAENNNGLSALYDNQNHMLEAINKFSDQTILISKDSLDAENTK
jgi:hypothetical protein